MSLSRSLARCIVAAVRRWLGEVATPGHLTATQKGTFMAIIHDIHINRTGNESPDTATGELTVHRVIGGLPTEDTLTVNYTDEDAEHGGWGFHGISCDQDTTLELSFVWIDDAGNRSVTPATLSLLVTDTLPPSDPGPISVSVVGESS